MVELFIPTRFDDLLDLDEQAKREHVKLNLLLFNPQEEYFCSEFLSIEDMISEGHTINAIKGYINDGLVRIISVSEQGKEKN